MFIIFWDKRNASSITNEKVLKFLASKDIVLVETSYLKWLLSRSNCYKHYHHWWGLDNQNLCMGICSHNQLELTERQCKTFYSFKTRIHYHFGWIKPSVVSFHFYVLPFFRSCRKIDRFTWQIVLQTSGKNAPIVTWQPLQIY